MCPAFSLANGAKKRAPLSLDDTADPTITAPAAAGSSSIIDAMIGLIPTDLIERISVRAIAQRAAFVLDRLIQHRHRRPLNAPPLGARQRITSSSWVDTSEKQSLCDVQIPNPRYRRLIE
jgi:hypothetical protein